MGHNIDRRAVTRPLREGFRKAGRTSVRVRTSRLLGGKAESDGPVSPPSGGGRKLRARSLVGGTKPFAVRFGEGRCPGHNPSARTQGASLRRGTPDEGGGC